MGASRAFLPFIFGLSSGIASLKAQSAAKPSMSQTLSWTFLVYMAADNDLEDFALADIREMETAIAESNIRILVQIDRRTKDGSDRIEIEREQSYERTPQRPFYSQVLETLPEQDTADSNHLEEFIEWGAARYSSDRLAVIIWGHGSGWQKTGSPFDRGIAFDDSSNRHLANADLRHALLNFSSHGLDRKIDLLILDSCLMNMSETLYALAGTAHFFVGSEETVPGDGLPYNDILNAIDRETDRDSAKMGSLIVKEYINSYSWGSQGNRSVQMSLISLDQVEIFRNKLDQWIGEILNTNALSPESLRRDAEKTQKFYAASSRDFFHFVARVRDDAVAESKASEGFLLATQELEEVQRHLVLVNSKNGSRYKNARGTAIYIPIDDHGNSSWRSPLSSESQSYRATLFGLDSRWTELLDYMYP